jgi:hypothetical protein
MVPPCHAWVCLYTFAALADSLLWTKRLDKDKAVRVSFSRLGLEIRVRYGTVHATVGGCTARMSTYTNLPPPLKVEVKFGLGMFCMIGVGGMVGKA